MAAPSLRSVLVLTAATMVVILLAGLQPANAQTTKARVNLRNCDLTNGYFSTPSPTNCPEVLIVIPEGKSVSIICKYRGSSVNGDSWWLYVRYGKYYGFVADYYVKCGGTCPGPVCSNPRY